MAELQSAVGDLQHAALQAATAQMRMANEVMAEARQEILSLRAQRDALLAACRAALPLLNDYDGADVAADEDDPIIQPVIAQIEAAVALAEVV